MMQVHNVLSLAVNCSPMSEPQLSERDVCTKLITPALERAGWDIQSQVREEVSLTAGRVMVRGRLVARGTAKRADYVLYLKPNLPLAVVEAKEPSHRVGDGMQQALEYADMLGVPFAFSSNGSGFLFSDRTGQASKIETELKLDQFPSPDDLWRRYRAWKGLSDASAAIVAQDYHTDASGKAPRYYQLNAINKVVEAVAHKKDRILLVMATGTGKTYTAFQIIWRLWKAGVKKRILFLADRNILLTQTRNKDFKPFGGAMTRIKNRQVDKSFEVYLALYQAITGTEESKDIFKQFSPDFFDLIVVDECHRGSAAADSAWREVLQYFSSATQLGLTATPKETEDISTSDYFGDPVYTYSLKQGIEDGFLAPYKVVRIDIDKDLTGWRPEKGKVDKHGVEIEDRVYNQKDFDRNLVLEKRTELVARKVTEFLAATGVYSKTIVFCEDIDHAERMRQALVNANPELCAKNRKYVMRITGDSDEGKAELEPFINPSEPYPVIVTTSKLMTTGVDAETCRVIVLDQTIQSMTEFKQIIGRGTRINEDYGKLYFTILDFKKATELFADPGFDGDPVRIYNPRGNDPVAPPDEGDEPTAGPEGVLPNPDPTGTAGSIDGNAPIDIPPDGAGKRYKFIVNDVAVHVAAERVQYYGNDGKLITESLRDYTRRTIREKFASLDAFLKTWGNAERKKAVIDELAMHGVFFDVLRDEVGKDLSPFDLVCHIAFDQPPLTRRERANNVRKRNYFTKYGDTARKVLDALLDKFANEGVDDIEDIAILKVRPINQHGTPVQIIQEFGGKDTYIKAVHDLEDELFKAS
jgi:type I restriction enzyme R subunit